MKRGPLLEFWVENIEKFRIYLNILKICVLKVYVPCNELNSGGLFMHLELFLWFILKVWVRIKSRVP